jgi:hypothetical protein
MCYHHSLDLVTTHTLNHCHKLRHCSTTIPELPTKLNLGAPAIVRPSCHPGLPYSASNKPPWSRKVRFDKVVTGLLGLPGPINLTCGQYKSKLAIGVKTTRSLIHIGGGYHRGTLE